MDNLCTTARWFWWTLLLLGVNALLPAGRFVGPRPALAVDTDGDGLNDGFDN